MKKPKRIITKEEFSKMVTYACIVLAAICGIFIISGATLLSIMFKILHIIFLFGVAVVFLIEFIFVCLKIKGRKEKSEFEENEDEEK